MTGLALCGHSLTSPWPPAAQRSSPYLPPHFSLFQAALVAAYAHPLAAYDGPQHLQLDELASLSTLMRKPRPTAVAVAGSQAGTEGTGHL